MVEEKKSEGLGISGFTLGVLGIISAGVTGLIISVVGLIFCMTQQKRHKIKMAKIGIILNVIGIILSIIALVLASFVLGPWLNQNFPLT